jgi:hypothetical protein
MTNNELQRAMTNKEFQRVIDRSLPIKFGSMEYAEPTIVSEDCEHLPYAGVPTYEAANYDNGDNNKKIMYFTHKNGMVAYSNKNLQLLKCMVCGIYCEKFGEAVRDTSTSIMLWNFNGNQGRK